LDKEVEETTTAVFGTRFHMDKLTKSPVMAEMRWLNMRGHQFSEPDLNSKVAALIAKFDELTVLKKARKNFLFAQAVATPSGETIISTCHVQTNGHGTEITWGLQLTGHLGRDSSTTTYVEGEVPEELVAKLAVLSMCEIDQYVSNVGMRVLGNACFAEITEEEVC
jgi:phage I-like protein